MEAEWAIRTLDDVQQIWGGTMPQIITDKPGEVGSASMATQEELAQVRGKAPEKRPTVRVLAAAAAHNDCALARPALGTRTDLDKLCDDTYFAVDFGQDPQAFQRGEMFERRVKDKDYAALIQLLREKAGFALVDVRIRDLRSSARPNQEGMKQRAVETKQLLRKIANKAGDAPNIIDGAVITCTIAGTTAYFEADGLAAATGGKLHVAEVKSFPITDGRWIMRSWAPPASKRPGTRCFAAARFWNSGYHQTPCLTQVSLSYRRVLA